MIGTSLGPYKILEQLGAGGMGEVWRYSIGFDEEGVIILRGVDG